MGLQGTIRVPGDKSISHRALILSSLYSGTSRVQGLLESNDVLSTQHCLAQLGVQFSSQGNQRLIQAEGQLQEATQILDAGNSGTSIRLLTGLLSAQPFYSVITGDHALVKRPMGRVINPLRLMGAKLYGRQEDRFAPISILPATERLQGIYYPMPIASAQVKSALLLAGLFAQGKTTIIEPVASRDHTERMLIHLGVPVQVEDTQITIEPLTRLEHSLDLQVPGDFSSAAFFMVAALLIPNSCLKIQHVGLNPQRIGLLTALRKVGANIQVENEQFVCGEPVGDLIIQSSILKGDLAITENEVPSLIDEIPILTIAGLFLEGTLTVTGAEELRKKESDRIQAMVDECAKLGITINAFEDGFSIQGSDYQKLRPQQPLFAHHDHRIAMALGILNEVVSPQTQWPIEGREWVNISYPGFYEQLATLQAGKAS